MLDFYSALGRAVRGRLDGAGTMGQINDALTDLFAYFELTATAVGVEVRPVLTAATAARIVEGLQAWPEGMEFGGRPVVRDERTAALACFAEPEEAALFEDAELAPVVPYPRGAPTDAYRAAAASFRGTLRGICPTPGVHRVSGGSLAPSDLGPRMRPTV
jgi:hypothetical protein